MCSGDYNVTRSLNVRLRDRHFYIKHLGLNWCKVKKKRKRIVASCWSVDSISAHDRTLKTKHQAFCTNVQKYLTSGWSLTVYAHHCL